MSGKPTGNELCKIKVNATVEKISATRISSSVPTQTELVGLKKAAVDETPATRISSSSPPEWSWWVLNSGKSSKKTETARASRYRCTDEMTTTHW